MGLFSFVKEAGAKLFGRDDEPKATSSATPPVAANPEDIRIMQERRKAYSLTKHVASLEIPVENLEIKVSGHTATVSGTTESQADREKIVLAIGNVDSISEVDDNIEVSVPEPEATFYTVQSGDSLSKIAKQHYGNAGKYPVIFEANKPMLSDPDKIYPGQVLRIPPMQ